MSRIPVIVIFDIGKTNKKILLFDEQYKLVWGNSKQLKEIADEDGFPCEDLQALTDWVNESLLAIQKDKLFRTVAINVSAYGASFVCLDVGGKPCLPLYNYLKPYPKELLQKFYARYGGESAIGRKAASPSLGNLNSGLQLYRLKYERPEVYAKIKYALHLPQFISYLLTSKPWSDITSIGCHTCLWDFQEQKYHAWVIDEGIDKKLAPVKACGEMHGYTKSKIPVGIGLHDSSAALIPYLMAFEEPFILLSTGTWSISLNPFNHSQLSDYELHNDCLCYLSYMGQPVKASRLFAGYEHEQQVANLAEHFGKPSDYYSTLSCNIDLLKKIKPVPAIKTVTEKDVMVGQSYFSQRDLHIFYSYEEAYHQLIADIIEQQIRSINLVLKGTGVKKIFVDGGFSRNSIFMHLLAEAFPTIEVNAATVPQASALGAALVIHPHWNTKPLPKDIIGLKLYSNALDG